MRFVPVLFVAACGSSGGAGSDANNNMKDAPADSSRDAGPVCLGDAHFTGGALCVPYPTAMLDITADMTVATDSCSLMLPQTNGTTMCVLYGINVKIESGATLRAIGPNPLALVAVKEVAVTGTLDVSSQHTGDVRGAGGDDAACAAAGVGADGTNAGGGGAGGSFTATGGAGGKGDGLAVNGSSPAAATALPVMLRGGCGGGHGGGATHAVAGLGGGSVYLVGGESVNVIGTIDASGGGGHGGAANGGGGAGGGTGGMVVFHAPLVVTSSSTVIYANGGGGGGGGKSSGAGADGSESTTAIDPPGGGGGASGGNGGNGAYSTNPANDGTNGAAGTGGGGGGGATGVIKVLSGQTLLGMISPSPS